MCQEYTPDELVSVLRQQGAQLCERYFRPNPDTDWLIVDSVRSNTFRSFAGQSPSEIFRPWAHRQMGFAAVAELGEVTNQSQMDSILDRRFQDLTAQWLRQSGRVFHYGNGRKLVNLLHKSIVRDIGVSTEGRTRAIPFLHVPQDKYVLAAVRLSAASGLYGNPIEIPQNSTMGYLTSQAEYDSFQLLMRRIAQAAGVAPICIDLLAWDRSHGRL